MLSGAFWGTQDTSFILSQMVGPSSSVLSTYISVLCWIGLPGEARYNSRSDLLCYKTAVDGVCSAALAAIFHVLLRKAAVP